MWPKLQNLITENELSEVSESVRTKLEGHLVELDQLIQSLKNETTELSAISERQQFQFEKEVFEFERQLKESTEECAKLRSQIGELETNLNTVSSQWREIQKLHDTVSFELQASKRANDLLTEEKRQIFEQLEKRIAEVEKLNGDRKSLLDEATAATEAKHAAIAREEEAKLGLSTLQHQVSRLEREKNLLEQQVSDMHNELSQKNHEILTLRKEKSTIVLELQSELENRVEELHHLQEQIMSLREKADEKDERIVTQARNFQELKESCQEMEEQYQLELGAQTKLVDLYKKASESNQLRVVELASAFEEAQKLLNEASDSRNEAESRAEAIESQYKVQLEKMEKEIHNLRNELKRANDLVEGKAFSSETLENFFPTAAATSKVMKSGMTLSQMYSEYVKAQEEIQNLKNENQRINEQMEQIISEIEENTPVINKRMADYMKSLETITHLQTQLSDTLTNQRISESEKSDLRRKCGQLERENTRLKSQITDLNRQIQTLLKEIEEMKGGVVRHETSIFQEEVSSTNDLSSDRVITKHLVTFRDIVDLQNKNQKLLAVVRELSEKQEQEEKKLIEERTTELQKELKNALSQVEDFRKERIKQTEMIQSIIRQRDMFRVLLTNQGFSDTLLGSPHPGSPGLGKSFMSPNDRGSSATKVAMNQLQSEFDNYKKEKAENERMHNEKLEKMGKELASSKIECTKLQSRLEYSEERLNLLQTNIDNYKKETTFLREKNQKHTASITQHQQTIHSLQQELMVAHDTIAKNTVAVDNLKAERDLLKGVEERLLHEKESLLREHHHKTEVLANLQAMQNNMERFESDTKRNLKLQVEKYEKDTALLKMQIESIQDEYKSAVKVWEKQEKELQQKINSEIEKNRKLHEDLVDAYSKFHAVNQELSTAKHSAGAAKADKAPVPLNASETKSLKEQLIEAQAKLKGLQEQLDLTRKSSDRYLAMCHDLELRIKEQDDINKSLKDNMESSLKSSSEARKSLEQNLENMEKSNRALIEDHMKVLQEKDSKLQVLQRQVALLQNELISHKTISETASSTAAQAREDCLNQKKVMEETQDKYERELILHANDVQALTTLKEEHQTCSTKIEELKNTVQHSEETLRDKEAAWNERELLMKSEHEALKKRLTELEAQNDNLLHQIQLMSTQLAAFRSEDWEKLRGTADSSDGKDTQHLLQIIQFVKNEKEILNNQFDAVKSENVRAKLKVEQLTAELKEVKKELKDISDNQQVQAVSDAQHAELLRKVETLNLLTESNNLLRLEKSTLTQAKEELEAKISKLEKENQPLSEKNREFESQIEMLTTENNTLRNDVKSWQSRTNQLLEQSHRVGPQEYRNLTRELEELKNQKQKLVDELQRKQNELSQLNVLKKEIETLKNDRQQKIQEIQKKNEEAVEYQKTMMQVKKIGRKYKTQYDELKILYDELLAKSKVEITSDDAQVQELRKQLQESEKALKDLKEETEKQLEKSKQEKETMQKDISAKEERFKALLAQLRLKYNTVCNTRDALTKEKTVSMKEKDEFMKELEDLKKQRDINKQGTEEESMRVIALKSQYENKIAALERDLKAARETVDFLEKQQEIRHKQKTTKPVAVSGIVERGSGGSEPLTANIKPLSSPSQSPGSSFRHATHTASPSPRGTPTASIRPMAIGSVASSSSSQARMAAVHPTTASASAIPPSVEEDVAAVIVSSASNVPHATVQPTPATATVAPTTVAVTITPSAHTPVISEVATNTLSSAETTVIDTPAPTASVIVSPPATQTQMVTPTVKRTRDDSSGSTAESPENSASAQKRIRMVSESSQTNQQASTSSNIAIVSAATVVTRSKEIPTSEVTPNVHIETSAEEPLPTGTSCTTFTEEGATAEPAAAPVATVITPAEEVDKAAPIEEQDEQTIDWEEQEDSKAPSDFAVEGMEEEEEVGEHMEDFDDERVSQDEDMVDDQDAEVVEMGEQQVEESIDVIDTLDANSDNQMEADNSSLQAPSVDQCMAPPAFPLTQVPEATSVADGIIGGQVSTSQNQRQLTITQRMQIRQPSTSRQHLQPFMIPPGQGSGFEEGDDSIVPSTPTLFVPRRTDGFAEAVSSPHVSSGRFLFTSSENSPTQQGLSQLASQGALGVDDTRMDLSQFDEGGGRTVPSTPLQVSPPTEENVSEVPEISELTSSQSSDASVPIPTIKIETSEGHDLTELESDHQNISLHDVTATHSDSEAAKVSTEAKPVDKESGDTEVSLVPTTAVPSDAESSKKESEVVSSSGDIQAQGTSTQNVRKPIVWEKEDSSSAVIASSAPTLSSSSPPTSTTAAAFSSPITEPTRRGTRSRRIRYRGTAAPAYRGQSEPWTVRRGRGRTRRSSMF